MPIQSTETFVGRTLTKTVDGKWTATRVWEVTGATTEAQVFSATPMDGSPIANLGNTHPTSNLLKVDSITPEQRQPFYWLVTVRYTIPDQANLSASDASKLNTPTTIDMKSGRISVAVDRDYIGRPRVNSAGDAFNPRGQKILQVRYLRAVRWEPFYNTSMADLYENTTNSNALTIGGKIAVTPQRLYCESIDLDQSITADAVAVPVAYSFILRKDLDDAPHPFNDYEIDQGRRGFYSNNGVVSPGEFFYANGEQCTEDVLLDGTGKPIDPTIKVGSSLQTPVANPNPPSLDLAGGAVFTNKANGKVKYIEFKNCRDVDFAGLNL